jgi:hypothetical protein
MRSNFHRSLGYLTAGVLLFLGSVGLADACSVSLSTVRVSPNFRVMVQHGTVPIPDISVEIYDKADLEKSQGETDWKPILTLLTGQDGAAGVHNLAPGSYLVQTRGPGAGSAVYARVLAKGHKTSNEISLEWPFSWRGILKIRTLAGELASNNPWTPFQNIHMELWTAGATTPLAVEDTGVEGHFHFNEAKPGIYILRIRGQQKGVGDQWQVKGDITIELSPSADLPDSLSLHLSETSCGLTYSSCPVPNVVAVASRRIKILDPLGAVIANAKYELLNQRGEALASGSTDSDGIAELSSELLGKMTLVIASPGFSLLKQPLELAAPDIHASDLLVSMALHGDKNQCSAVTLEKHATP